MDVFAKVIIIIEPSDPHPTQPFLIKMLSTSDVTRRINELSKNIRRKYVALKWGKSEHDTTLNKLFQPITNPINKLVKQNHQRLKNNENLRTMIKEVRNQPSSSSSSLKPQETTKQIQFASTPQVQPLKLESVSDLDMTKYFFIDDDILEDENVFDDEAPIQNISNLRDEVYNEWLEQYHPSVREYIEAYVKYDNNGDDFDKTYGLTFDPTMEKQKLGNTTIDFDRNTDELKKRFKGTVGHYELD